MKSKRQKLFDAFLVIMLCCGVFLWLLGNAVRQNVRDLSLLVAISESDAPAVHRLLQEGADANASDRTTSPTLMDALRAWRDRLTLKRPFPQKGVVTALILALTNHKESALIVKDLLEHGADPDQSTRSTWTPLMVAFNVDRQASACELLAQGANVNAHAIDGTTPLMTACYNGSTTEIVKRLIAMGSDVNACDVYGDSVLTCATNGHHDYSANVSALVDAGANVNFQGQGGRTAMINAAFRGQAKAVRILLDHGADIHARNAGGDTPLQLAQKQHASAVVAMLNQAEKQWHARHPGASLAK